MLMSTYVHICTHRLLTAHVYVCIYMRMFVYRWVRLYTSNRLVVHAYAHIYTCVCTHGYIYIYIYTHTNCSPPWHVYEVLLRVAVFICVDIVRMFHWIHSNTAKKTSCHSFLCTQTSVCTCIHAIVELYMGWIMGANARIMTLPSCDMRKHRLPSRIINGMEADNKRTRFKKVKTILVRLRVKTWVWLISTMPSFLVDMMRRISVHACAI